MVQELWETQYINVRNHIWLPRCKRVIEIEKEELKLYIYIYIYFKEKKLYNRKKTGEEDY